MNLIENQISYGLIKEQNFRINPWLDDNGILMYSTHNQGK